MVRETQRFDVLVIGGGPAGIAAAVRAAERSLRVGIIDDNPTLGGQIWRNSEDEPALEAARWLNRLQSANITKLPGMRVLHQPQAGVLLAEASEDLCELHYRKLVVATGARERFLPFPGWTLPNVMGAGGLQAMVKGGLPIRGKRVIVAGTGPLLLAVAAYLRKRGAEIPIICEQVSWSSLSRFAIALCRHPRKIIQASQLKRELTGVTFAASSWPLAAHGSLSLQAVDIWQDGKSVTVPCDYLACGFHLIPNTELARLIGCSLDGGRVLVDRFQQTTIPDIFCAGEPTGIGGVELSVIEGEIAGLMASGRATDAQQLFAKRERMRGFARMLDKAFRLRNELALLPLPETIVCRCEDVTYGRLQAHTSWRAAKLQTRCGMGPCQGRVCGPATEFLFGWKPDSLRPPVFPARVENLAVLTTQPDAECRAVSGDRI